ncbi:MAG: ATP synthase F1 subunit delta [Chloroflexi bacterium]|nr:ATP synthase F1 subunit delta [Chloroflexota bacterium]
MARKPTARRYAQAAFAIAREHRTLDRWSTDLDLLVQALDNPDFAALLEAPQVPEGVKQHGIETVLHDADRLARNLLAVLVAQRQTGNIKQVRAEFRRLVDENSGVARAEVVTAVPLDDRQKSTVIDHLGRLVGRKVVASVRVDPEIIAGIVARVGDRLIDGSARAKLEQMRMALERPPVQASAPASEN